MVVKDHQMGSKKVTQDQTLPENKSKNRLLTFTGHADGKVIIWQNMIPYKKAFELGAPIVEMSLLIPFIGISTEAFKFFICNLNMDSILRTIDLSKHNFRYYSFSLKNIVASSNEFLLNTYKGDFLKVKLLNKQ